MDFDIWRAGMDLTSAVAHSWRHWIQESTIHAPTQSTNREENESENCRRRELEVSTDGLIDPRRRREEARRAGGIDPRLKEARRGGRRRKEARSAGS